MKTMKLIFNEKIRIHSICKRFKFFKNSNGWQKTLNTYKCICQDISLSQLKKKQPKERKKNLITQFNLNDINIFLFFKMHVQQKNDERRK